MNSYLNFFFFVLKDDDERAPCMMKNFRKIEKSYLVNGCEGRKPPFVYNEVKGHKDKLFQLLNL